MHLYIKHYTLCTGVVNVAEREQKCLIRSSRKVSFDRVFTSNNIAFKNLKWSSVKITKKYKWVFKFFNLLAPRYLIIN